jgi:hypothetical protein
MRLRAGMDMEAKTKPGHPAMFKIFAGSVFYDPHNRLLSSVLGDRAL